MENRIEIYHEAEIPKKSRSLDLKSLYQSSKGSDEAQIKNLKRKGANGVDNFGVDKRKKSRKAVSISSFRKVNGNGSKSLEEVYNGSLSSVSHDTKDLNQRLNSSSLFSPVSQNLEGSFDNIPRRKRGFVGRKKVESASQVLKPVEVHSDKGENADQVGKLPVRDTDTGKMVESLKVKQKNVSDDFKESNSGANSHRHCEDEDGHTCDSVSRSVVLSQQKSQFGHSIKDNDQSSKTKSLRKRSRKRKDLIPKDKYVMKEAEPSIDPNVKVSQDLRDDEENLEENAARMLSSRFDPSCTGFSSSSKASPVPSSNGLSFLLSSGREFPPHGSNYVSGSESASLDAAARVLRPRKEHNKKGSSRKRRHYYEILSGNVDAYWLMNRRIKVFWPLDQSWYYGLVSDYDNVRKLHHVKYDDRDEEWINLQGERFKLLLLPSEVPGKPQRKRSRTRKKISSSDKGKLKPSKVKRDSDAEDDSYTENYMDSEPIISWLSRSSHRVKSSPLRALKKQKTSCLSVSSLLPEESANRCDHSDGDSLNREKSNLSGCSALPGTFTAGGRTKVPDIEKIVSSTDNKLPVVYYRRRFRNASGKPHHSSEVNHISVDVQESDASPGQAVVVSRALERLWKGLLKLNTDLVESTQFRFELGSPVLSLLNLFSVVDHARFCHALMLQQHGTLMPMWPRIHMEMMFVDNSVGLRFFLFEGCLKQAIAFVLQVLALFHQPIECRRFVDLQLPVTSIKCKFSCIQDVRKQLVFAFYNFSEVENSKWMHLDSRLKRHCLQTKQLPLSECTYDNVKTFQNGTSQLLDSSVCRDSTRVKGSVKRLRHSVSLLGVFDKSHGWFPPFALSFAAAPTFFMGLHLKLLLEHSVTHISFKDHDLAGHPENSCSLLADDCNCIEDCSNKCTETTPDNNSNASSRDANCDECLSCAKTEQAAGISVNSTGDCMKSSTKYQHGNGCGGTSAISQGSGEMRGDTVSKGSGEMGRDDIGSMRKWQYHHHSGSEQCDASPKESVGQDGSSAGSHSLLNGIKIEIPSSNQLGKHDAKELCDVQQSTDLTWNMNGGIIPSSNPTARRSTWHRNRSSSTSFGYHGHGWSDGRGDLVQNNFANGPKKPRTQVSYALPFGGFDCSSKNKGQSQKGIPHKRIRTANERRSYLSRDSERNLEILSCEANILITLGDRGWRECGAQVILELFDHNEWKLAVKLSGITKYSYKAHQFLQPGSTNRYTHAMMWKGGKDWILEFPDRSQWTLFKEMHEECYNRNIHAASVKNIPIPGVRLIEEHDDSGIEVPFIRYPSKYFQQVETDAEMALDPSRVLYDMDSDDEQWLSKTLTSSEVASNSSWEILEETFEKVMDIFEKAAYSRQRDQFTSDEMEELMAGVGSIEVIKVIHGYWQQKRERKGIPLIRHLQPPLWEMYQQQVKDWELKMTKSNVALPNGCHEKAASIEKPPMFAFCLKPRGLEVPNKGSKQRSHRKISVIGQRNSFSGDRDSFHAYGRRLNGFASGDENFLYQGHNYEPLDDSSLPQISPRMFWPRDAGGKGYFLMSSDRYDPNHLRRLHRSKSTKDGTYVIPNDTQMVAPYDERVFGKRNGFHRWNMGFSEWPNQHHYYLDGSSSHAPEQFDSSDPDEFKLCDVSGAAKHARNIAKLKRERAQRLLYRADLAIHKAVVALMTAEAIKLSSEDINSDG